MLAKKFRLPIQNFIGKGGKVTKTPFFLIKVFKSEFPHSRFGIIISKKAVSRAAARNQLKRMIFSALREFLFPGEPQDFIIIVSPKISQLKKEEIAASLKTALNKSYVSNHSF